MKLDGSARFCGRCGKKYVPTRNNQRYCTDCIHAARKAYWKARWKQYLLYVLFMAFIRVIFSFLGLLPYWSGRENWPLLLAHGGLAIVLIVIIVDLWRQTMRK